MRGAPVTTPRLFLSASVRRGLEAIGAGMLDHACPDQRAAIAWARALSEGLSAPQSRGRQVPRARAAASQHERRINHA